MVFRIMYCVVCKAMTNFGSIKEGGKKIWYCKKCGNDK